jgi:hypothetical protein
MSKKTMLVTAVVAASAAYDFYRGYHAHRSVAEGIVWVIGGFVVLAFFWWVYSIRSS